MNARTPAPGLETLAERGILDANSAQRARDLLRPDEDEENQGPWFLRALQVVGAWLSAIFFLGFLAATGLLDDESFNIGLGLILIVGATAFSRMSRNLFFEQALTAISIAGHCVLVVTLWSKSGTWTAVAVSVILLCVTYPFFRGGVHRVFSCHFPAVVLLIAALEKQVPNLNDVTIAVAALGVVVFHSGRCNAPVWRPAAYSAVSILLSSLIAMGALGGFDDLFRDGAAIDPRIGAILVAAVLPLLPLYLQRHNPGRARLPILLGAVLIGALAFLATPAIAAALWIFIIGHLRGDRILFWLGALSLSVALTYHYYNLEITLLVKSVSLIAVGATFLLARLLLSRLATASASQTESA